MFINYFKSSTRESPLNLAVARVLLGVYLLWKVPSLDIYAPYHWPGDIDHRVSFLISPTIEALLPMLYALSIISIILFIFGYRIPLTSFLTGSTVSVLTAQQFALNSSGGSSTVYISVLIVFLIGLFADHQYLSVDRFRRTKLIIYNSPVTSSFSMAPLKWGQIIFALTYFGSGIAKVISGPLFDWAIAQNLGRYMLSRPILYRNEQTMVISSHLAEHGILILALAWLTLILQIGFLVAILSRISITPFVLGLLGFHIASGLTLGMIFYDNMAFFLLFVPWDSVHSWFLQNESFVYCR
jgi:hypothetical protein